MREFLNRLFSFFRRGHWEAEINAEIESHITHATDDYIRSGLSPEDARHKALLRFNAREAARELHREARSLPFLEYLLQDLRYAFRGMRREPAFAAFAILIIALGIGASVTVFSVLNTVLVRPLPFKDPEGLVWIANSHKDEGLSGETIQSLSLAAYKERNRSFSDVAAYFAFYGTGDSQLTMNGESERLNAIPVTENFFPLLGVQPQLGRLFTPEECKWNGPKSVLMSYGLWVTRFASDPNIVRRQLILDNRQVNVVGVLPASFDFGSVFAPGTRMDLYFPFSLGPETDRWGNTLSLVGRLKPGTTLPAAESEAVVLSNRIQAEVPNRNDLALHLTALKDHVSGKLRPALTVLAFAVGVVMLIVCANLSNLLLARSTTRQKEFAIRSALGAGRTRLIRQILTESILLACCGGLLGSLLAFGATAAVAHLTAFNIPMLNDVHLDLTALLCALLLAIITGIIFGVVPALQVPSITVNDALKDQNRGSTDSHRHAWLRGSLVVAEIAFACVLIVGTGLLLRSFLHVLEVDLGFQPARAAAMRIDPSKQMKTQEQANAYTNEVLRRVRDITAVEAAGLTDSLPLGRNRTWGAAAKGEIYKPEDYPSAFIHIVSGGYLRAMGIPLKAGRDFSQSDTATSEAVIMINESLAKRLWPGQNPLGKLILAGDKRDKHVVGIVSDIHHVNIEKATGPELYLPITQSGDYGSIDLVVRSRVESTKLSTTVRSALLAVDAGLPREQFRPLMQMVDRTVSPRRFVVLLLSGFAAFALILASLGIYAVISYSVSQRSREIGIRLALGAAPADLKRSILWQTLRLAAIGLVIGTLASRMLTQALSGMLFGVRPGDPITFAAMILVLVSVAAGAGYLPARRAARTDPMLALRAD